MANVANPNDVIIDVHDKSASKLRKVGMLYTGPSSYVTGGDAISGPDCGLGSIDMILFAGLPYNGSNSVYLVHYRAAAGKILWYVPNTNAEVANGVDLSSYIVRIEAIGH